MDADKDITFGEDEGRGSRRGKEGRIKGRGKNDTDSAAAREERYKGEAGVFETIETSAEPGKPQRCMFN